MDFCGVFLTVVAVPGFVAESPGASNLEQLLHTASVSGPSGIYSPQKTKGTVSFDTSRSVNRFHKTSRVLYHSVYWDNYNQYIYHSGGFIKAFRGKLRILEIFLSCCEQWKLNNVHCLDLFYCCFQVRKAAHQGVNIILRGSSFMTQGETAPPYHPAGSMTAKFCIQVIEQCGGRLRDILYIGFIVKSYMHS